MDEKININSLTEDEQRRLARVEKLDSNKKRKKFIFAGVTAVLITFFVLGTVFGIKYILSFEGTQSLPEEPAEMLDVPENIDEAYSLINKLVGELGSYNSTKLDVSFKVKTDADSIAVVGEQSEAVKTYLSYVKDSLDKAITSCYENENYTGEYGNDFSAKLFSMNFDPKTTQVEITVDEDDEEEMYIDFIFPASSFAETKASTIGEIFDLAAFDSAKTALMEKFSSVADCEQATLNYTSLKMSVRIDREKPEITRVTQERVCEVVLPVSFKGEWQSFGTEEIKLSLTVTKTFKLTNVEFGFKNKVFYIEKGSSEEFKTFTESDFDDENSTVTFTSSNPEILSIDERFYKGEKVSADPVTVTGTYVYKGVTYTDTCLFYVRIPVESVKVQNKEMSLSVGETGQVETKLSPSDSTLTTLYWFSEDESIATVDENGTVTAKAAGTVSVYCITLDGNYKSSCTVEVKG